MAKSAKKQSQYGEYEENRSIDIDFLVSVLEEQKYSLEKEEVHKAKRKNRGSETGKENSHRPIESSILRRTDNQNYGLTVDVTLDDIIVYHDSEVRDQHNEKRDYPAVCSSSLHSTLDLSPFVKLLPNLFSLSATPVTLNSLQTISCISFHDCPYLVDGSIDAFLKHAGVYIPISNLAFSQCPQLTDKVCESISNYNCLSNLQQLHFRSCNRIGDKGIHYLVFDRTNRKKLLLSSVTFSKCPLVTEKGMIDLINHQYHSLSSIDFSFDEQIPGNVTDKVLLVMADRYSSSSTLLRKVNFSGCNQITDMGVQEIVSKCCSVSISSSFRELYLSYCPKLTSNCIRSFYKIPVLYGSKMNTNLRNLTVLHLEGNQHLTLKCLYWIGKACSKLEVLNLKRCLLHSCKQDKEKDILTQMGKRIDYYDIRYLSSLSCLKVLDLNECKGLFLDQETLQFYLSECELYKEKIHGISGNDRCKNHSGLELFDLSGFSVINDMNIEGILKLNPSLNNFAISGSPDITDKSIFSIAERLKKLEYITLSNLTSITNSSVQAISKYCFHSLLELDISSNQQLRSVSLQNLDRMRVLVKLNISYCSQLDDMALKWLPVFSLRELLADGLPLLTDSGIEAFCKRHKERDLIQHLSFQDCPMLTKSAVECICYYCTELKYLNVFKCTNSEFDFHGKDNKDSKELSPNEKHANIDVSYVSSTSFCGLIMKPHSRDKKINANIARESKRRKDAATLVQSSFRSYLGRREKARVMAQETTKKQKKALVKLSFFFKVQVERYRARKRKFAREIVAIKLQQLYRSWERKIWVHAVLCRRYQRWKKYVRIMRLFNVKAEDHYERKMKLRFIHAWLEVAIDDGSRISHQQLTASFHWRKKTSQKVLMKLHTESKYHRKCLAKNKLIFMLVAHTDSYNTFEQKQWLQRADLYRKIHLYGLVWERMKSFVRFKQEQRQKMSDANNLAIETIMRKYWSDVLKALNLNAKRKFESRELQAGASMHNMNKTKRAALRWLNKHVISLKTQRRCLKDAKEFHRNYFRYSNYVKVINTISMLQCMRLHQRQLCEKAKRSHVEKRLKTTLHWWLKWEVHHKKFLLDMNEAIAIDRKKLVSKYFLCWKKKMIQTRLMMKVALIKCRNNRIRKTFYGWAEVCSQIKIERQYQEKKNHKVFLASTKIQKVYRGRKTRKGIDEWKNFRNWAVLLCQAKARVFLSKQVLEKKRRMFILQQYKLEEKESNLMAIEDHVMKSFLLMEFFVRKIQKVFRGRRGRRLALEVLQDVILSDAKSFKEKKSSQLMFVQNQEEERIWMSKKEDEASLTVGRIIRGFLGRCQIKVLKRRQFEDNAATIIQSVFRGRQDRRRCAALIRHNQNLNRRTRARMKQARYLKLMRFKTNSSQQKVIHHLMLYGLEATTYVPSLFQQVNDMKKDVIEIKNLARDLLSVWIRGKFDRCERKKVLQQLTEERMKDFKPFPGDTVRVIIEGHQYSGMTAQVLYYDKNTFHEHVAVVRMDIDGTCHHFCIMEKQHKFLPPKPTLLVISRMHKAQVKKKSMTFWEKTALTLHAKNERFESIRNRAAIIIQNRIRYILSKNNASTKRYHKFIADRSIYCTALRSTNQFNIKTSLYFNLLEIMKIKNPANRKAHQHKNISPPGLDYLVFICKRRIILLSEYRNRRRSTNFTKGHDDFILSGENYNVEMNRNSCRKSKICRTKKVQFLQLEKSPHVRMSGLTLYRGMTKTRCQLRWNNVVPHGVGYAEFFQGFGNGYDDKTLTIKVCRARGLSSTDFMQNSDPFVAITCNARKARTAVKINTPDPVWNEEFQIHVSDPNHVVKVVVYDWDRFSGNDFLGQVFLYLSNFKCGKRIKQWYRLNGKNEEKTMKYSSRKNMITKDLGMIELEIMWNIRKIRDDTCQHQIEHEACIILQCWTRIMLAKELCRQNKDNMTNKLVFLHQQAVLIQSAYRSHKSYRKFKKMKQNYYFVVRIQCFVRTRWASARVKRMRYEYFAARSIQCAMRRKRSILVKSELTCIMKTLKHTSAISIQTLIRKYLSIITINKTKCTKNDNNTYLTMSNWITTYGIDQEFGTKRMRRFSRRVFNKILHTQGKILVSKYGEVTVDQYPAPVVGNKYHCSMVKVFIFGHRPLSWPKKELTQIHLASSKYTAVIRLSDVDQTKSIAWHARIIQCFFRVQSASSCAHTKRLEKQAILPIQRTFRVRYRRINQLALNLQGLYRVQKAKVILERAIFVKSRVIVIQCALRSYLAKVIIENQREIKCSILDSSGSLNDLFEASKVLDHKKETFWCTKNGSISSQWITFDLQKISAVGKIKIQAPEMTSSPMEISITASNNYNKIEFAIETLELKQIDRWQVFELPKKSFRFWKVSVLRNFGNSEAVTISGIRFISAKESKLNFIHEPESKCLIPRNEKEKIMVELSCYAKSYPPPSYQWLKNGTPIQGETKPKLKVCMYPQISTEFKLFRCLHCRRISKKVPTNIYKIVCSHCKTKLLYPELTENISLQSHLREQERKLSQKIGMLLAFLNRLNKVSNPNSKTGIMQTDDSKGEKIKQNHEKSTERFKQNLFIDLSSISFLNPKIRSHLIKEIRCLWSEIREKRYTVLRAMLTFDSIKLPYHGEGEYTCKVGHTRNGVMYISKLSKPSILYVVDPEPSEMKCYQSYVLKQYKRMLFPKYSSIYSSFEEGHIVGNVVLNFETGEQYRGPFVENSSSVTRTNHLGIWKTRDGTLIEGSSVDNHFDQLNMQGTYRVTFINGEKYEGYFVDGKRHGKGEYKYEDGTVYKGDWFQGKREGMGTLTKVDGSMYDGEWELDHIDGEGVWCWADGSMYVGHNVKGKRSGRGVYTNSNSDRYVGEFHDNQMQGQGVLTYSNGSKYIGNFFKNKRVGDASFIYHNGDCHLGTWKNDNRDGTFTVKRKLENNENVSNNASSTDDYEVQVGIWENGNFVQWITRSVNPRKTALFIDRFLTEKENFGGAYAKQIAKGLPFAPDGVDENNPDVQNILFHIASENPIFVGTQTCKETEKEIVNINKKLKSLCKDREKQNEELSRLNKSRKHILEKDNVTRQQIDELNIECGQLLDQIEAFWLKDKDMTRQKFYSVVTNLKCLKNKDWFSIRRYHQPPEILKNLMSTVCCVMMVEDSWKMARMLLGSNTNNKDQGSEDGIWQKYDIKILFMLEKFDVFLRTDAGDELLKRLANRLDNTRMRSDDFTLRRYGSAAITLIEFVQASHAYILKSYEIIKKRNRVEEIKNSLKRNNAIVEKTKTKLDPTYQKEICFQGELESLNQSIILLQKKKKNLDSLLMKCTDMSAIACT